MIPQKFMDAIRVRFSMIDVAKHQIEVQKKGAKNKLLILTNEVKIITSSDATFDLWKEVISCAARGDLIDVDTKDLSKFKDNINFEPEKDGVLTREFFKFLGNLSEEDHAKMCKHILNRSGASRRYNYPKVVIRQPSTVVEDCYSVKEWIERRKRKATARMQLHIIRPELGLFVNDGKEFAKGAWKKFKKDFHVSRASMRVLLDWGPGELYYVNQRQTQHRNTDCEDLSPYAKQFFTVFLAQRSEFVPAPGAMFFRPKRSTTPILESWPSDSWQTVASNVKLGVIDFRFIPGTSGKSRSTVEKPYFEEFMKIFSSKGQPELTELPAWLFICGDSDSYSQVEAFARKPPLAGVYDLFPSQYVPASNERLGGHSAKSKMAIEDVRLLFLIKCDIENPPRVKKSYVPPNHIVYEKPRKYNEIEYALYPAELRMEFYLKVLDLFCQPTDAIFQLFCGTKLATASMVSDLLVYLDSS